MLLRSTMLSGILWIYNHIRGLVGAKQTYLTVALSWNVVPCLGASAVCDSGREYFLQQACLSDSFLALALRQVP